jgi:pyruvate dehydrogenase E2 component (dihydrolipoamide acetyltransferase)
MAQFEFKLPDLGEGVVEGEIVKWLVKAGDEVSEDQGMVEMMTDKATVTIPSPRKGKVVKTIGSEGTIAKVHETLVVMDVEDGHDEAHPSHAAAGHAPQQGTSSRAQAAPSLPAAQAGQPAPLQTAGGNRPGSSGGTGASAGAQAAAARPAPLERPPAPQGGNGAAANGEARGRVLATPVTRRMARELGVDLSQVGASGPQGRVMKADLLSYVEHGQKEPASAPAARGPAPAAPPPLEADEVRPLRGLRKSIAKSMVQSHTYVVPFTFVEECDTAALTALRARINAALEKRGEAKLTYLPFITKALVAAFRKFPELNAVMDEEKQALIVKKDVNMGYGAATPQGLTEFVVRDVANKSLRELGAEIDRLAKAARDQKLQLADLQGGTFTITSLGKDGGILATPVVHHPEVAILGIHKIKEWARPVRGADGKVGIEIGERMNLSCSFDHRVIDGHVGAAFLYEVIHGLEAPEALLID